MDKFNESAYPEVTTDAPFKGGAVYSDVYSHGGLTKLEAFTMAAMQGLCANTDLVKKIMEDQDIKNGYEWIAVASAKMARATLSELSKQK